MAVLVLTLLLFCLYYADSKALNTRHLARRSSNDPYIDQEKFANGSIRFECCFGFPCGPVETEWLWNNGSVPEQEGVEVTGNQLTVLHVRPSLEAEIRCRVNGRSSSVKHLTSRPGNFSVRENVNISEPPVPVALGLEIGSVTKRKCSYRIVVERPSQNSQVTILQYDHFAGQSGTDQNITFAEFVFNTRELTFTYAATVESTVHLSVTLTVQPVLGFEPCTYPDVQSSVIVHFVAPPGPIPPTSCADQQTHLFTVKFPEPACHEAEENTTFLTADYRCSNLSCESPSEGTLQIRSDDAPNLDEVRMAIQERYPGARVTKVIKESAFPVPAVGGGVGGGAGFVVIGVVLTILLVCFIKRRPRVTPKAPPPSTGAENPLPPAAENPPPPPPTGGHVVVMMEPLQDYYIPNQLVGGGEHPHQLPRPAQPVNQAVGGPQRAAADVGLAGGQGVNENTETAAQEVPRQFCISHAQQVATGGHDRVGGSSHNHGNPPTYHLPLPGAADQDIGVRPQAHFPSPSHQQHVDQSGERMAMIAVPYMLNNMQILNTYLVPARTAILLQPPVHVTPTSTTAPPMTEESVSSV